MKKPRTEHHWEHQDLSGGDTVESGESGEPSQEDAEPKKRRIIVIDDRCLRSEHGPAY